MTEQTREVPYDVDVEQALLGAILVANHSLDRIAGTTLKPEHFYDPLHERTYGFIQRMWSKGHAVTPLTLKTHMEGDAGLSEVGGQQYLVSLARAAPALPNVKDYARILIDLAVRRECIRIGEDLVNTAYDAPFEITPQQIADGASERLFDAAHGNDSGEGAVSVLDFAHRAVEMSAKASERPHDVWLSSGIDLVDSRLDGFFRGEVTILGASTSMGKTAFAQGVAKHNARAHGHGVLINSLEMGGASVALRYVAEDSRVPANRARMGKTTDIELDRMMQAAQAFADIEHLLKIDATRRLTVAQLRARALAFKRRCKKFALWVIDHLQFIEPADPRASEPEQLKQITHDLCEIAMELDVAILLLCHILKEVDKRQNKRPVMGDLFGASAIQQNADAVWFIYRPHYYLTREEPDSGGDQKAYDAWALECHKQQGWAEIFSTKARMGKTGTCRVRFEDEFTRFYDPSHVSPMTPAQQAQLELSHAVGAAVGRR